MAGAQRPLIAGNWKMNGLQQSAAELDRIIAGAQTVPAAVDLLICPPATLIASFSARARGSRVAIGAQDCHAQVAGAYTGDISAVMLKDAGATAVIVGHSERRTCHQETDAAIRAKALAATAAGLQPIVCVGEVIEQRKAGGALDVVGGQLQGSLPDEAGPLVVAYEPVWAIGTGLTPTAEDIAQMHAFIRARLRHRYGTAADGVRVLYGGSVKSSNATEILRVDNVDGALVGGASLKAEDFLGIAGACG